MKGMPLPFDFEGKGVLDLELIVKNRNFIADTGAAISSYFSKKNCFVSGGNLGEPNSVLESVKIGSRPTSSSTLSSSLGGGAGGGGAASTDTAGGVAAVSDTNPSPRWRQDSTTATSSNAGGTDSELLPIISQSVEIGTVVGGGAGKFAMEDWESVLSESVAVSPSQEQSVLRWIMGDVEDPSMGSLNKFLQIGGGCATAAAPEFEYSGGFGVVDQGLGVDQFGGSFMPALPIPSFPNSRSSAEKSSGLPSHTLLSNLSPNFMHPSSIPNSLVSSGLNPHTPFDSPAEVKPPIFAFQSPFLQNPPSFPPLSFPQLQPEQNPAVPPLAKRHNPGGGIEISKGSFLDTGQPEMFTGRQQLHQQQFIPHYVHQRPMGPEQKPKIGGGDELLGHSHLQQAVVDQLYKAAELVQTGNPVLAQGILARLNHQLSPVGNPFIRAAFYCKEALQQLLQPNNNINNHHPSSAGCLTTPFGIIFKVGAYKSFSEVSPMLQFANFTCNQALLEAVERFDRIHILDFDVGYGTQWASLMQELALRTGGAPSLFKITAIVSAASFDQLEIGLARENLIRFAAEVNVPFEFEAMSIESLNSGSLPLPFRASETEAVSVNLPIGSLANCQLPLVLSLVKQLSPRIVVSVDRGCDRTDLLFPNYVINSLQSYSNLLDSLDAVNVNAEALQKIEKYLVQPGIEKLVMDRFRSPERTMPHWRALFLSSGFTPVGLSNFTEAQADCLVKRIPVRGFQVEKRQSSLVLCWQRKELISASAWRC